MQRASPAGETRVARPELVAARPLPAALAAVVIILTLYWGTVQSLVRTWSGSETFKHGWVVVPIALWLAWRDRGRIPLTEAKPAWSMLLALALAGLVWFVGDLAAVASLEHLGLVLMVQSALVCMLGFRIAGAVAFPLGFLLFAVPIGEFMIPTLMSWTADFTIAALRLTGIPVLREGNSFVIPSGTWSVVEACSGIRYLVASFMVGSLYAYLTYRSALRRAAFVLASTLVPIVANWLRAYLIVLLGHYSDNTLAVGVDHLVYGWIFFGVVIASMFWLGSLWREDEDTRAPATPSASNAKVTTAGVRRASSFALALVALVSVWPLLARGLEDRDAGDPLAFELPAGGNGWQKRVSPDPGPWSPGYTGARATDSAAYEKDGRVVRVFVAYYRNQSQGRELVSSGHALVSAGSTGIQERSLGHRALRWADAGVDARVVQVAAPGGARIAASWYWVDGALTSSDYQAKARQALARLSRRGDDGAVVVLSTASVEGAESAQATLEDFARDMGAGLIQALTVTRGEG